MRKSGKNLLCVCLAAALALTACSGGQGGTTEGTGLDGTKTQNETEQGENIVKRETVAAPTNYVTDAQMALADQWAGSDEAALAAVMKKAEAGEKVTVAVIGGSITQGTISNGASDSEVAEKKMYAEIFHDWWTQTFPDTEIEFINAGIGATDSYLAVHRVQKDVLDANPDLVLVEFSVNDANTIIYKNTYDNLVRKILLAENHPAIMLLFMAQSNDSTAQDMHSAVGFNYGLPMVSYRNVMNDMLTNNVYTAEELSGDVTHPSALGHRIVGEIIWKYLNSVYEVVDSYGEPAVFDKAAVTNEKYAGNAQIMDNTTLTPTDYGTFADSNVFYQFPNDWSTTEGEGGITFEITCKNLGVMYYCQTDGKGGQYDVYVDGEKVQTLDADFTGGWGNYAATKECYTSDEAAAHTVEIRKADGSTGDEFTILGFLVSE